MPTAESAINMQFLAAMNGGVAAKADTAQKLAEFFSGTFAKHGKSYSIQLIDKGDRWQVQNHDPAAWEDNIIYFDIRKVDASLSPLPDVAPNWTAIDTADAARKFAMLILKSVDPDGANDQLPLTAHDQGNTWLIQGSLNCNRAAEGPGPFKLEVQKRDAKVVDIGFEWVLKVPPEVRAALRRARPEHEE
jgi:hypothetical protein